MNELPPPGWYPDSHTPGVERWWDGRQWSPVTRPAGGRTGTAAQVPGTQDPGTQAPAGQAPVAYAPVTPGKPLPYTPDGARLASWGRRAAARILDGLVIWAIALVVGRSQLETIWRVVRDTMQAATDAARSGATYDSMALMDNDAYISATFQLTMIFVLVSAVYEIPFLAMRGATPAKLLFGLRVRRWETPELPSWGASLGRWFIGQGMPYLASVPGSIFWWVDNLFPLWDGRRQTIHDKAARTVVVRTR